MADTTQGARRPVILGEVLFDVFPEGQRRLGGAPFNVAWHLEGLGLEPLLITRVGEDEPGRRILDQMTAWGLDTAGVQVDPERATGRVEVHLGRDEPRFEIAPDQAFDHLSEGVDLAALAGGRPALVYHGSLISRNEASRRAVEAYRARTPAPVFLDVNLRPPWWSAEAVAQALLGARWVKLNADELCRLEGVEDVGDRTDVVAAARGFKARHALEAVIVTLGGDGAFALWGEALVEVQPPVVVTAGTPVGAGDAFSAVVIAGVLLGWPVDETLRRAADLAAVVCTVDGAVSADRGLYRRILSEWGGAP